MSSFSTSSSTSSSPYEYSILFINESKSFFYSEPRFIYLDSKPNANSYLTLRISSFDKSADIMSCLCSCSWIVGNPPLALILLSRNFRRFTRFMSSKYRFLESFSLIASYSLRWTISDCILVIAGSEYSIISVTSGS